PERTSRKTPIALGELRGVARLCAAEADIPVSFYPPARVKLAITGSGRAAKEDVIRMVSAEFGVKPKDDNEADAISIAYTHILMRRFQTTPQTNP
ncbi:MAG TPA: crossover junction endodeoxyribonuclease RuvC, partial [Candidatus Ozemobacteraceae bacterium]|nr:crossover junction endodeoxyribonuclease RuvC [Candidatus Ozemobacteraceae bacterium]